MRYLFTAALLIGIGIGLQAQSFTSSNSSTSTSNASTSAPTSGYDPLLDLPPLPRQPLSLIGGTIIDVDGVMNRLTVRPFGDRKNMRFAFDVRTTILADGKDADVQSLKPGQRVYIDSMLISTRVFAKSIRIETTGPNGSGHGQIMDYDASANILTLRDELSGQPVHFHLSPATVIRSGNETRATSDLVPGSLVSIAFQAQQDRPVVREVTLLAKPGSTFSFFGKITFVDMSRRTVAVDNQNDGKNYEIHLMSIPQAMLRNLHEGAVIGILAVFDGTQYVARNVEFAGSAQQTQP